MKLKRKTSKIHVSKNRNTRVEGESKEYLSAIRKFTLDSDEDEFSRVGPPPNVKKPAEVESSASRTSTKFGNMKSNLSSFSSQRFFKSKRGKKKKSDVISKNSGSVRFSNAYSHSSKDLGIDDIQVIPTGRENEVSKVEIETCPIGQEEESELQRVRFFDSYRKNSQDKNSILEAAMKQLLNNKASKVKDDSIDAEIVFLETSDQE